MLEPLEVGHFGEISKVLALNLANQPIRSVGAAKSRNGFSVWKKMIRIDGNSRLVLFSLFSS